jgi:hypothetical protein
VSAQGPLAAPNGGYARACRRGRRSRSAIIGGMLEPNATSRDTVAQTYLIAADE